MNKMAKRKKRRIWIKRKDGHKQRYWKNYGAFFKMGEEKRKGKKYTGYHDFETDTTLVSDDIERKKEFEDIWENLNPELLKDIKSVLILDVNSEPVKEYREKSGEPESEGLHTRTLPKKERPESNIIITHGGKMKFDESVAHELGHEFAYKLQPYKTIQKKTPKRVHEEIADALKEDIIETKQARHNMENKKILPASKLLQKKKETQKELKSYGFRVTRTPKVSKREKEALVKEYNEGKLSLGEFLEKKQALEEKSKVRRTHGSIFRIRPNKDRQRHQAMIDLTNEYRDGKISHDTYKERRKQIQNR